MTHSESDSPPPSLHSHYSCFLTTTRWSVPDRNLGISVSRFCRLYVFPYHLRSGSHVPHESLNQARAAYLPVTVQPVNRLPLDSVPGCQIGLVSMTVECLSTEHPRFTSVRLPGSHLTSHARRFPDRSPPGNLSPSGAGQFEGWSCNPPPEGLPPSFMQQSCCIRSTFLPPAYAVMAHFGEAQATPAVKGLRFAPMNALKNARP